MTSPEAARASTPSVWEDFVDVFYAPSQVFARRETGNFGVPLLIVTLATVVLYLATAPVMAPIYEAEAARQMEAFTRSNPSLAGQAAEAPRTGGALQTVLGALGIAVGTPVTILIVGVTLWLVGKLFESQATLRAGLVVATYSFVPRLLEWVLNAVQAAFMDPSSLTSLASLSLGPARFLDPETASPMAIALAMRVSAFVIWTTALLAIGLKVVGKIPMASAAAAAAIVWLLGAIPSLIPVLMAR